MIDMFENIEKEPQSVSQLSQQIKSYIEGNFNKVVVKGEIFGSKRADSGHWYLSLKDDSANLSAVCWKGVASHLTVKIEDGLEVIARGKITTFAGKSSYQLVIESLEPAGQGALLKLLEQRKEQFIKEGLFDESHKKSIPYLPKTIGVVTSPTGAVIRDIIHRIRDRFPSHIVVWPTPVQGDGSAEKIAAAISGFNQLDEGSNINRPDVIIVARGGGSLEDLWSFNEEVVIRAVYNSKIPIISAVGHETDTMLIDYVADKRAPTPTGAAEMAVPVKADLEYTLSTINNRVNYSIKRYLSEFKEKINGLSRGIPNLKEILNESSQKLDYRIERLETSMRNLMIQKQNILQLCKVDSFYINTLIEKSALSLNSLSARLSGVSIASVLSRGFAWIKGDNNTTIYSVEDAKKQNKLEISLVDGKVAAQVVGSVSSNTIKPKAQKQKVRKKEKITSQTSLFDLE